MADDRIDALYLTYDGLLEPLGQSQVVCYLEELSARGVDILVISFEKPIDLDDETRRLALTERMTKAGVRWLPLVYHQRPRSLATIWDVTRGFACALFATRRYRPNLVHARSYVAGLIALLLKLSTGIRFIFDMRGFWPEERVELGLFRSGGILYRASKRLEELLLRHADQVIVLTEQASGLLRARRIPRPEALPIEVIPCCVHLERFALRPRNQALLEKHALAGKLVVGNIGAVNQRYLIPEMLRFLANLKEHRSDLRFVYLTRQDPGPLLLHAQAVGLGREELLVLAASPEEVPDWLTLFRLGVFFLRPSYAAKASSFTKLGEFLASGVPVVTNAGVGDVERILKPTGTGLVLSGITEKVLALGARRALPLLEGREPAPELQALCRRTAIENFDLDKGATRYLRTYENLTGASFHDSIVTDVAPELS